MQKVNQNHKIRFRKTLKVLYLKDVLVFWAHIALSYSTYEYFGSSKYEARTPSHHGDTKHQYFERIQQYDSLRETITPTHLEVQHV